MKLEKIAILLSTLPLLGGCAFNFNGWVEYTDETDDGIPVSYHPVGIPYIFGGHGSSTPITKELSITAAHVAIYNYSNVIAYHKYCDVAIIESDNSDVEIPLRGSVSVGDAVAHYGIGLIGLDVKGDGVYRKADLSMSDGIPECLIGISDGAMQSGMSGGGTYNSKGEFVGVNVAVGHDLKIGGEPVDWERSSMFVTIDHVDGWIEQVIEAHALGILD